MDPKEVTRARLFMPLNEIGAGAGAQARTQNLMLLTRFGRPAESEPNLGRDSKPYALVNEIRLASRARAELGPELETL